MRHLLTQWLHRRRSKKHQPIDEWYVERAQKRTFHAAEQSRLASDWSRQPIPNSDSVRRGLEALRARSRDLYRNNDHARRFVSLTRHNVVGPQGIQLKPKVVDPDGTPDPLANEAIADAWRRWGRRENADIAGQLSWVEQQRMFAGTVAIDGEVLVRQITGRAAGEWGFALQFIDPQLLPVDYDRELRNGTRIRMGIEFNKWGRPLAYHVKDPLGSRYSYQYLGRRFVRIPAEQMIHAFLPEQIWQGRGVPWMSSAMLRMKLLDGYEEAAVVAARTGAAKMGFYKTPSGAEYVGTGNGEEGSAPSPPVEEAEAGTFAQMPNEWDFQSWDPTYPHDQYGAFIKACLRGISAGLGVSYHNLANDLESVNFSSARAGVLEEREAWKTLQEWMIDWLCRPVYERWLRAQLLQDNITVNGRPLNPQREDKYRQIGWQPRRWPWVDPMKDMNANTKAIENNLKSRSQVISEDGRDPADVWNELQAEREQLRQMGLLPEEQTNAAS